MPLTLALPDGRRLELDSPLLSLGSAPDSGVVITDDPRVKPRHAELRWAEGRWTLIPLEGTVLVNGMTTLAALPLLPGDTLQLGEPGPEIVFQPAISTGPASPAAATNVKLPEVPVGPIEELDAYRREKPAVVSAPSRLSLPAPGTEPNPRPLPPVTAPAPTVPKPRPAAIPQPATLQTQSRAGWWMVVTIAVLSVAAIAIVVFPPRRPSGPVSRPDVDSSQTVVRTDTGRREPDSQAPPAAPNVNRGPRVPTPVEGYPESPPRAQTPEQPSPDVAVAPEEVAVNRTEASSPFSGLPRISAATPGEIESSLYAILLQTEDKSRAWRLGTACAVTPRQLATSASIILAAERLRTDGKLNVVLKNLKGDEIAVIHLLPHPDYRRRTTTVGELQTEIEALGPAQADERPEVTRRRAALTQEHARMVRQQLWYDVGLLTVANDLPAHLRIPYQPTFPNTAIKLVGLPFSLDALSTTALAPQRSETTSRTALWQDSVPGSAGWSFSLTEDSAQTLWSGSPILTTSGTLAGIYSRPSEGKEHLATDAARIQELLLSRR